jgi:hypothetical protein
MTTLVAAAVPEVLGGLTAAAASSVLTSEGPGVQAARRTAARTLWGASDTLVDKGNMGYGEGLKLLEQMVKQNQLVRDQMKMDLREFMKSNLHGNFAPGSLNFPRGGGLPVQGYRLPGSLSAVVKNRLGYPINSQKEEKTI